MAAILLTGADGQLGWEVARQGGAAVHATTRTALDVTNRRAVADAIGRIRPGVVVNTAAYTSVDRAEAEPQAAFAVNRDGPAHLAEACARADTPLIHISTDYVFDGSKAAPYIEDDTPAPLGVYGASKLAGEDAVRSHGPHHVILRTAWVYGVHGHNFVKTMLRLAGERAHLRVVDDQHGCPTFATDLAAAVLAVARRCHDRTLAPDGYGTFHCGGGARTTWCGFARAIFDLAGPRLGAAPSVEAIATADYPTPARRPMNSVLACDRLRRVHGIALRPWAEALPDMLDAVLSRQPTAAISNPRTQS